MNIPPMQIEEVIKEVGQLHLSILARDKVINELEEEIHELRAQMREAQMLVKDPAR